MTVDENKAKQSEAEGAQSKGPEGRAEGVAPRSNIPADRVEGEAVENVNQAQRFGTTKDDLADFADEDEEYPEVVLQASHPDVMTAHDERSLTAQHADAPQRPGNPVQHVEREIERGEVRTPATVAPPPLPHDGSIWSTSPDGDFGAGTVVRVDYVSHGRIHYSVLGGQELDGLPTGIVNGMDAWNRNFVYEAVQYEHLHPKVKEYELNQRGEAAKSRRSSARSGKGHSVGQEQQEDNGTPSGQ